MNNNHSPFSVHNLNPNLVGQVEDAYQRNIEAGRVVDDEFTGVVAKESLSDVMARIKKNLTSHEHAEGGALAEQITNHETLAAFESAFQDTTKLFDRISVSAPRPEDLESGGVEFYKLAELYEDMEQQGLEPQIVIAPHQDNQSMWTDLYGELVNDKDLYWSTGRKDEEQSVWFAPLILSEWKNLNDLVTMRIPAPIYRAESEMILEGRIDWTVRLIPTESEMHKYRGLNYDDHHKSKYPTIAEYLTLQAIRIQADRKPIDSENSVWLTGNMRNLNAAIQGFYQWGQRKIVISHTTKNIGNNDTITRRARWL